MFRIDPSAYYSTDDLRDIFEHAGFSLRWFLDKIHARKFDRSVWFGGDLLEATLEYTERRAEEKESTEMVERLRKESRGRKRKPSVETIAMPTK